jgi:hypothetical protein
MPPIISEFKVTRVTDTTVRVSFRSTEELETIAVSFGVDVSPQPEMDEGDFTRSLGVYSGTIDLFDDDFTATLDEASNGNGDGADGQTFEFTIPWPAPTVEPRLSVVVQNNDAPVPVIVGNNPTEFTQFSEIDRMTVKTAGNPQVAGPVTLSFGEVLPNREIRYTTNGKNPTSNSKLYNGPFVIRQNLTGGDNTVIKARYFDPNNPNTKSKIMRASFRLY